MVDVAYHLLMGNAPAAHHLTVYIMNFYILEVLYAPALKIGHSQFLSLVNIGCPLHHIETDCQHFGGQFPEHGAVIAKAGHRPGIIVILPKQAVPGLSLQFCLPPVQHFLQLSQTDRVVIPFSKWSGIQFHMFKMEHHVQFMGLISRILHCLPGSHAYALSHAHPIKPGQDLPVHLL